MASIVNSIAGEEGSERTLSEQLFNRLNDAIVSGELRPGSKLSEPALARQYGVSRGPLREAINRLQGRHLVTRTAHFGARVANCRPKYWKKTFIVREARREWLRAKQPKIALMMTSQPCTAPYARHVSAAKQGGEGPVWRSADEDFHMLIARASGNPMLVRLLTGDFYQLVRFYRSQLVHVRGRGARTVAEHRRILEAIEDRDGELAELHMRRHIAAARAQMSAALRQQSGIANECAFILCSPFSDRELIDIADYVTAGPAPSELALDTARACLVDTLGCGLESAGISRLHKIARSDRCWNYRAERCSCAWHQSGVGPGASGIQPGRNDPLARFQRHLACAEWGHPSDNLGGILMVADWLGRNAKAAGRPGPTMNDVLRAMIQAHEIQGCLALENSFNKVGFDHVVLVKVASTAVIAKMLGLSRDQIIEAVSLAWVDGQSLRTYRHAPTLARARVGRLGMRRAGLCASL